MINSILLTWRDAGLFYSMCLHTIWAVAINTKWKQDGGSQWINQNKQPSGNIPFYFFQGSFLGSPYRQSILLVHCGGPWTGVSKMYLLKRYCKISAPSSCTSTQDQILNTQHYTIANQRLIKKGWHWLFPQWNFYWYIYTRTQSRFPYNPILLDLQLLFFN